MSAGQARKKANSFRLEAGQEQITVGLVAPALALRVGLRTLLAGAEGIEILFEVASLIELASIRKDVDVLVILSGMDSIDKVQAAIDEHPASRFLLLADADLDPESIKSLVAKLLRGHRAWGLLSLEATAEELTAAIYALAEGLVVYSPSFIEPLLDIERPAGRAEEDALIELLTERETQVLALLAEGLANKQIALKLGISEHTVKFHISGIYSKLGATNRTEAVRQGVRRGLIVL